MDRLEIERQLQRHEQQLNSNNNQKAKIAFWNFNTNNNTQENVAEFLEKQFSNINHELSLKPNKKL